MNNEIFSTEEYQNFKELLMRVSRINNYNGEQHNNIIDFLNDINVDEAKYIIELLIDFFDAGLEYGVR